MRSDVEFVIVVVDTVTVELDMVVELNVAVEFVGADVLLKIAVL